MQLTDARGFAITVNVDHITWFNQYRDGDDGTCAIRFDLARGSENKQDMVFVKESYEEIRSMLSTRGLL